MKRDQEVLGGTDLRKLEELIRAISATLLSSVLLLGCSKAQHAVGPAPDVRVSLSTHGLPADFFRLNADTKCSGQIIGCTTWLACPMVIVIG